MAISLNACMATKARRKSQMSDDHKAALAIGRTKGRVVRRYLDALEANKPKRGRKRTPESIQRRLKAIEEFERVLDLCEAAARGLLARLAI